MTSTLRNNLLVHWAIPVGRTRSVHTCDKICSVWTIRLPRSKHMRLSRAVKTIPIEKSEGRKSRKTFFHNLLDAPLPP
jgi:hypothetical protein